MRVGLLLAAGLSRRFDGEDKLLAPFRGAPLVSHAAAVMAKLPLDHRLAVTSSVAVDALLSGFNCLRNPAPGRGQGSSLSIGAAAAHELGATRLLVMLGDMPLVTLDHCLAVLKRCTDDVSSASADHAAAMPPACLCRKDLERFIHHGGDTGANNLISTLPAEALVQADTTLLTDIDTRQMLEAAH